jgi:1,4-dihydroxy-2-naphthoate octaprenyltransferase
VGVIAAHMAVNLFNELSDFSTKIDENTQRTPFSGGSGMMQSGQTAYKQVRFLAFAVLTVSAAIGIYFIFHSGWLILPIMLIGGISILFYTSHFSRWLLGEIISGIGLGTLVVIGSFYALTGFINLSIIMLAIPPGILTALLLFLNEFPDMEADQLGGRHHLVIHFGKKISSRIYVIVLGVMYLFILMLPIWLQFSPKILIALLTLPLAVMAGRIVWRDFAHTPRLIPALGMNVGIVILTDLLLAVSFFI